MTVGAHDYQFGLHSGRMLPQGFTDRFPLARQNIDGHPDIMASQMRGNVGARLFSIASTVGNGIDKRYINLGCRLQEG